MILNTRGKVKVRWGNGYIDIIKNGRLNIDVQPAFREYSSSELPDVIPNGLIFIEDTKELYFVVNGERYRIELTPYGQQSLFDTVQQLQD